MLIRLNVPHWTCRQEQERYCSSYYKDSNTYYMNTLPLPLYPLAVHQPRLSTRAVCIPLKRMFYWFKLNFPDKLLWSCTCFSRHQVLNWPLKFLGFLFHSHKFSLVCLNSSIESNRLVIRSFTRLLVVLKLIYGFYQKLLWNNILSSLK